MFTDKSQARQLLWSLLGDLPSNDDEITSVKVEETEQADYILEKLVLDLNGIEPVPAYFAKPKGVEGVLPAIIYNHAHGGDYDLGKDELIHGRKALAAPPYAQVLTNLGYSVLCIDTWAFGERSGKTESEIFKFMLWHGQVMWGMMVFDSLRALDYLTTRQDVDINRIGTIGMSMGSTMAWWMSALDERIKLCIDICCLTDFRALIDTNNLDGHSIYYYVPGLLKHFSAADINALIAPRAHLSLNGIYDRLTPLSGLEKIDAHLKETYRKENAADAWKLINYHTGHMETAAMRAEVVAFLEKWM